MDKKILVTRSSMPSYEEYIQAIKPLWESHWLTNMGVYHQELENKLKDYLGVQELSLMVNGHMSLELIIQAMNFPNGSEIITTPFTFISTTHAIVRNNLKPVFCDVNLADGTINETKIENLITEKTVAIIPVHVYGNVCDVEAIQEIADKYNLKVIYDAAHAFGVQYKGKGIGSYGDASIFSFHATKVFNTVEGGAAAFTEHRIYEKLYNLKDFGIRGEELIVDIGANAKMNEFSAIMGLCNLKHINDAIKIRENKFKYYYDQIKDINGIRVFECRDGVKKNYAYFPIIVDNGMRDGLYEHLKVYNVFPRKYFYPLTSDQACFKNKYKNVELMVARELAAKVLVLPFYEEIQLEEIDMICSLIKDYMK